ncbi:alpha-L-fucosidase [Zhouia amylolytica]|uniref:alpha-L-fucosidase n=1 Tax=Zhouia amylolytica TaxID=376730 RepID=UPI0020CC137C|nr:alpha-L-fucosidase [Zhouia amylolytica]MCQ0111508.1 alpha-L-fucosidase [Zhouia amylolytica]
MSLLKQCFLGSFFVIVTIGCSKTENKQKKIIFEPTVASLQQYRTPDWYADAKFGIYCHWNAQSASKSKYSGWYARHMYEQGSPAYNDHLKNWGHPSEVGYKDIIEAWNPDKFDADRWVKLFKEAGAKYVLTMAVHHDNFDFWDSKYQPRWNSLNYGPKVDVCKEMREACLREGIRWGARTHLGRSYSWFQTNKGSDTTGVKKGIPYDGNNPDYEDLYIEKATHEQIGTNYSQIRHPLNPSEKWMEHWKNRMFDLIDNYHPDHLYFDGASPFMNDEGQAGLDVIAHYYNHNASRHNGENQGVMVIKDIKNHGYFYDKISTVVLERTRENNIVEEPRETENSTGPWFYTGDETGYRSSESLLHEMIDVVSKNCNFVLNIPPRPDGSFDDQSLKILKDFGMWFKRNGEAIYGTRAWHTFSEDEFRFTAKAKSLFAIALKQPGEKVLIRSLNSWKPEDIMSVEYGFKEKLNWELTTEGLEIKIPEEFLGEELAYVFRISCSREVKNLPYRKVAIQSVKEDNEENSKKFGADGNGGETLPTRKK